MPLTMFVNIYLKSMRNREQNTHNALEHLQSGPYQTRGIMGTERAEEEKQKSKGVRILQRGTFQEHKMRSEAPLACLAPAIHHAYKHTRSQHEQLWGVRVCANKCGSFSVKRYDLLTMQSFTAWLPNTFLAFY